MRLYIILSMLVVVITAAYAQQAADLLPYDDQIPGWVKNGPPQTAQTEEELFGLINGAAPPYIENGFVECVFQDYLGEIAQEEAALTARVFDQGTAENAQIIYQIVGTGLETDWDGAGSEARINYNLPFNFTLEFWRNRFYVYLVIDREADSLQALQTIQAFAVTMDDVAVPVELQTLHAYRRGDVAVIAWKTASESDCFGFKVLRAQFPEEAQAQAISEMIPGGGTTSSPRDYRFIDPAPPLEGILYYWLQEISLSGAVQLFGPAQAAAGNEAGSWGRIKSEFASDG